MVKVVKYQCPNCGSLLEQSHALRMTLAKNFIAVQVEVEEPKVEVVRKPVKAVKPVVEETEDEDLRLEE
jgi:hypothetical protein